MKIIFAGTSDFAVTILDGLYSQGYTICCVICQPDRPKGRKKLLTPCPVKEYALQKGLTIYQPEKISSKDSIQYISSFSVSAFVVAAYGQKLPSSLLYFTPLGAINVHGSLLPDLRGAAPIQHSIIRGFSRTGVTTMLMNEGMDTGDILLQSELQILDNDTYGTLSVKLAKLGSDLLLKTLPLLSQNKLIPIKQDDSKATKSMTIKKEETEIDFSKSARDVYNLIRGLNPHPYAFCKLLDKDTKIIEAKPVNETEIHSEYGTILSAGKNGIELACGKGSILVTRLQPAGGKEMDGPSFANRIHK